MKIKSYHKVYDPFALLYILGIWDMAYTTKQHTYNGKVLSYSLIIGVVYPTELEVVASIQCHKSILIAVSHIPKVGNIK